MKKIIIAIIAIVFVFAACSKDEETLKNQKQNNNSINNGNQLKNSIEQIKKEDIIQSVQSFQSDRRTYKSTNTAPDYTQTDALFKMPLVLNFEKGGYGYFSDLVSVDLEISIDNKGVNANGETLLSGKEMFRNYLDIETYVNTQLGDRKLFNAEFKVVETNVIRTLLKVTITSGTLHAESFGNKVSNEFPVIPVNINPHVSGYASPSVVAHMFTAAYNSVPVDIWYCRAINQILVNYSPNWISADPMNPYTHFVYHSSNGSYLYAQAYNDDYYNWINNSRLLRLPYGIFAKKVSIDYYNKWLDIDNPPAEWYNYMHTHILSILYAKYENVPELFTLAGLPIIN